MGLSYRTLAGILKSTFCVKDRILNAMNILGTIQFIRKHVTVFNQIFENGTMITFWLYFRTYVTFRQWIDKEDQDMVLSL